MSTDVKHARSTSAGSPSSRSIATRKRSIRAPRDLPADQARCKLRLTDVVAIVGCGRSTWYGLIARGLAPAPQRLPHTRISVWDSTQIQDYLSGQTESDVAVQA